MKKFYDTHLNCRSECCYKTQLSHFLYYSDESLSLTLRDKITHTKISLVIETKLASSQEFFLLLKVENTSV